MTSEFNDMFERMMEKRRKNQSRHLRKLDLGNTESGRYLSVGRRDELDLAQGSSYAIREYKQNPGATKGRGFKGGIRK